YEAVLQHCRETVGYPIVHNCMINKHGMGDRESNLAECRTHSRPVVSKCVEAAMLHGKSLSPVVPHGNEVPEHLAGKPKPGVGHENEPAATPPTVSSQTAVVDQKLTPPVVNASFGRRVALIIGNGDYEHVPKLPNATNDAKSLAAALTASG